MAYTKTSKTQSITQIGILLVVIAFGYLYFAVPKVVENKKAFDQKTADLQAMKDDATHLADVKSKLETALMQSGVDLKEIDQVVPPTEDMPGLYIQMENILANNKDLITSLTYNLGQPVADPAPETTASISATFTGTASYAQIKSFISVVQHNLRPINIDSVSLQYGEKGYGFTIIGKIRVRALSAAYTTTPTQ